MKYVLYNTLSGRKIKEFETLRGAKISLAQRSKKEDCLGVMESEEFENTYNKWTTTHNLLTGEVIRIREQDVGSCVDPATERYWTM